MTANHLEHKIATFPGSPGVWQHRRSRGRGGLEQNEMTVGSANVDDPQELLNTAQHHCQAIQTIIDQLTEIKSNTELRLLSQRLQRLAFTQRRGVAMVDAASRKPRLPSTGASSSVLVERLRDHSPRRSHCIPKHKSPTRLSKKCWSLSKKMQSILQF
jgi:hypothetical protein